MLIILWGISPVTLGACLRFIQMTRELALYEAQLIFIYDEPRDSDLFICRFQYLEQLLRGVDDGRVKNGECWSYLSRFIPANFLTYARPKEIVDGQLLLTDGTLLRYDYLISGMFLPILDRFFASSGEKLQVINGSKIIRILEMPSDGDFDMNEKYITLRKGHRETIYNLQEKLPYTDAFPIPVHNEGCKKLLTLLEEKHLVLARGRLGGWKNCWPDEEFMQGVEAMDFALAGKGEEIFFAENSAGNCDMRYLPINLDWMEDEIEFVVANYNETWQWARYVPGNVTVYHKGFEETPTEKFRGSWIKLKNVGMEAHTYLTHIVRQYHQLAPVTAFFLGKIKKHQENGWIFSDLAQYKRALQEGLVVRQILQNTDWSALSMFNNEQKEDFHGGIISPSQYGETLREYWQYVFDDEPPLVSQFSRFPIFSVRRDIIHKHSLNFYQKLLDTVSTNRCPQETYFLRAIWLHIFSI